MSHVIGSKIRRRLCQEDHAFGTIHGGKRIGAFGDVACFSFDGIKNITSGEGGCVVTDDTKILSLFRDARLLGVEWDTEKRYTNQLSWTFDVTAQGWRYHMSNIMAAIGLEQLRRFDQMAAVRRDRARLYDELLQEHPRIRPVVRDYDTVVPHIYVVRISGLKDRNALQARLLAQKIQTGFHYYPNHYFTRYRDVTAAPLPVAESASAEMLTLPLRCDLSETDVAWVCDALMREVLRT